MARKSAFGEAAERFAARLPDGVNLIASGLDHAVLALEEAVDRRRTGELFYVSPLLDEPRALVAQRLGGRWIERLTSIDDRYRAFDALAGDRLTEAGIAIEDADLAVVDEPHRRVLRDFAIMSDALLARSTRDAERVARLLGRHRPFVAVAPGEDGTVPQVHNAARDAIVVWAPHLDANSLGVIAMALEYMKAPIIYVCAGGRLDHARGDFVSIAGAAAALERAACVVDASISDPAAAVALARLGVPIVTAATSGASEFLDGVFEYEPWDWRSIFAAVSIARGGRAPASKRDPLPVRDLEATLARTAPPVCASQPLVSIAVVTYNRRHLLPIALDSLARQTYANIEAVVVNNAGEDVADVVARYPFARLITLPENVGPNGAWAAGVDEVRGKYFAGLNDDDEYFPDHLARLVYALETTGAQIAHTNTATKYIEVEGNETRVLAYRVRHDRTADRLQMLVGGTMVLPSMLFRRDVLDAIGSIDCALGPADLEYQMRAAQRFDFIHVDVVTYIWEYRLDRNSHTHSEAVIEGMREIYRRYPSGGSRIVERRREAEFARFEQTEKPLWPPDLLLPERSSPRR